jgi:hypothetical protein
VEGYHRGQRSAFLEGVTTFALHKYILDRRVIWIWTEVPRTTISVSVDEVVRTRAHRNEHLQPKGTERVRGTMINVK